MTEATPVAPTEGAAPAATETPVAPAAETVAAAPVAPEAAAEVKSEPSLLEAASSEKIEPTVEKPADKPEAKAETKPDAKTEAKPESKSETKADKKDEPAPAEAKSKDEAKATDPAKTDAAEAAPLKYEFKLPDGIKLDDERLGKFTEAASKARVPQEIAQEFLSLHLDEMKKYSDEVSQQAQRHQRDVWGKLNDTWKTETRKELGNHVETDLALAKAVVEEFGGSGDQVREYLAHLNNNGMGNYIGHIRLLRNIGKALNVFEDSLTPANPGAPKMQKGSPGSGKTGWYNEKAS